MLAGIFHKGSLRMYQLERYNVCMVFTKGHEGFNKGKKLKGEWRNCLRCEKRVWFVVSRLTKGGGNYCSRDCSNKSNAKKGNECWNYKGSMTYGAIHDWLHDTFGSPSHCEKCGVIGRKIIGKWNIEWAKVHGVSYDRKRENFKWLCTHCHIEYDGTSIAKRPVWNKGRSWTKEERLKISKGTKRGIAAKNT